MLRSKTKPRHLIYIRRVQWWEKFKPSETVVLAGLALMCLASALPTF